MLVREVMSTPAITVAVDASVREALRLLDEHAITALPVVDKDGAFLGIVSEADLVREAVLPDGRSHMIPIQVSRAAPARSVAEVMSRRALTVTSGSDLADAVDLMTSTVVKSLPVVDRGQVVGMVSRRDVVHMLARHDDCIRHEIEDLVRSEDVAWRVEVIDGVVRIAGTAGEQERRVAEVLAASVPGVVAVCVL